MASMLTLFVCCMLAALAVSCTARPTEMRLVAPTLRNLNVTDVNGCGFASYKQCDSRWGSNQLGTSSNTICSAGCAMTSMTMFVKTRGGNYDPGSMNQWLKGNGGYSDGDLLVWGAVNKLGVVSFQAIENPSQQTVIDGLGQCHGIIANVRGGSHWVLLTGYAGNGNFYVNDPGFDQSTYPFSQMLRFAVYH